MLDFITKNACNYVYKWFEYIANTFYFASYIILYVNCITRTVLYMTLILTDIDWTGNQHSSTKNR